MMALNAQPVSRTDGLLAAKKGLIVGAANPMSIAWSIAEGASSEGAMIGLSYEGEAVGKRIRRLAAAIKAPCCLPCNVSEEADLDALRSAIELQHGRLDFMVHSVAFADKDALSGRFTAVSADAFQRCLAISCHSLIALTSALMPVMNDGCSILTLTSYGSEKVLPGYGLMGVAKAALEASVRYLAADLGDRGIRVNAISAGPLRTLSSSAVPAFTDIKRWNAEQSLLRRNVTLQEVADTAVFLLSDRSRGITAEVLHVDSGHHAQGMRFLEGGQQSVDSAT
jgi:enoyl-[acyl-carrier protein] reductase I